MNKIVTLLSGFLISIGSVFGATTATSGNGAITMGVFSSSAPNFAGSPSWSAYSANAMNWLRNGGSFGNPDATPNAYAHAASIIHAGDLTVSSFNSWRGDATPSAPTFQNELGNRLHFGLSIEAAPGVSFLMSDISYTVTSTDNNVLGFVGDFSSISSFSSTRVGVDTAGQLRTSGSAVGVPLREFYFIGVGTSYQAFGAGGNQQQIQNVVDYVASFGTVDVTGLYSVNYTGAQTGTFSVSDTVSVIPEPTSAILAGSLCLMGILRRKRC